MPDNTFKKAAEDVFSTVTRLLFKHKIFTEQKEHDSLEIIDAIKELHSPRKEQAASAIAAVQFLGTKFLNGKLKESDTQDALKGFRAVHLHMIAKSYKDELTNVLQHENSSTFNSLYFKQTVVDLGLGQFRQNEKGELLLDAPLELNKNIDYKELKKQINFIAALIIRECYVNGTVAKGVKLEHSFTATPEFDVQVFIEAKNALFTSINIFETQQGKKATAQTLTDEAKRLDDLRIQAEEEERLKAAEEARIQAEEKAKLGGQSQGLFAYAASWLGVFATSSKPIGNQPGLLNSIDYPPLPTPTKVKEGDKSEDKSTLSPSPN